jgi:osmotically-inducible protein OsmY
MKTNEQLQKDVMDAIMWEPELQAAEIGVTVHEGIVTLLGTVDNYNKKMAAEVAAKEVEGVKALIEKIEVKYDHSAKKTDEDIASDVLKFLHNRWNVPYDRIKVEIENGWVTLTGDVTWNYQKESAQQAIENIPGVKGVSNNIKIRALLKNELDKNLIEKALKRHWSINADDIHVDIDGNEVILTGKVTSLYQKEEASKIAWKTPGVSLVDNKLVVDSSYKFVT